MEDFFWAVGVIVFMVFVVLVWLVGFLYIISTGKEYQLIETTYQCPTCRSTMFGIERHPESKNYLWCPKCEKWERPWRSTDQ